MFIAFIQLFPFERKKIAAWKKPSVLFFLFVKIFFSITVCFGKNFICLLNEKLTRYFRL